MFEVQQYGQPPPEIIQGVAPGLMFDSSGLPSFQLSGASKPTGPTTTAYSNSDGVQDELDENAFDLPPEFNEEIAKKIASGDCPTM
jgi:hypothetical protein